MNEPIRDDNVGKIRVVDASIPMDIEIDGKLIAKTRKLVNKEGK